MTFYIHRPLRTISQHLERLLVSLAALVCVTSAQALNPEPVFHLYGVTASIAKTEGYDYEWVAAGSEYPYGLKPDYAAMVNNWYEGDASSTITLTSEQDFEFSCLAKAIESTLGYNTSIQFDKEERIYIDTYSNWDDEVRGEVQIRRKMTAGTHTVIITQWVSGKTDNYVFDNISANTCDHSGNQNELVHHDATCKKGSYDTGTCSVCSFEYETPEDGNYAPHVNNEENGQDHECDVCGKDIDTDADGDGYCDGYVSRYDEETGEDVLVKCGGICLPSVATLYGITLDYTNISGLLSNNEDYMPGIMTNSEGGNICIDFSATKTINISFDCIQNDANSSSDICGAIMNQDTFEDEEVIDFCTSDGQPYTYSCTLEPGSYQLYLNLYPNSEEPLYIYNFLITACDHKGDTSEAIIEHVEATCTMGSHDVRKCSICGARYAVNEAKDKKPHVDNADGGDGRCDVCDVILIEKMCELSRGVEVRLEIEGHSNDGSIFSDYGMEKDEDGQLYLTGDAGDEEYCSATITISSQEDFSLSFDYSCDSSCWDERYHLEGSFSIVLYSTSDGEEENISYYSNHGSDSDLQTITKDLKAGVYYLEISVTGFYRTHESFHLSNIKALTAAYPAERLANITLELKPTPENLENYDLNNDNKITIGDVVLQIEDLKAEQTGGNPEE